MAERQFRFGPQPVLDRAIARQHACERALVEARAILAGERDRLADLVRIIGEVSARIRESGQRLERAPTSGASGETLATASRFDDMLRIREAQTKASIEQQHRQIRWARQRVDLRVQELNEALSRVRMLERMRERACLKHRRELLKKQDKAREEGIDLHMSRRRPRREGGCHDESGWQPE